MGARIYFALTRIMALIKFASILKDEPVGGVNTPAAISFEKLSTSNADFGLKLQTLLI
jgi:hypothetical protein